MGSVITVGKYAFYQCISLKKVDLRSAEHIGSYAFGGCFKLKDVTLANVNNLTKHFSYFNFKSANKNIKLNLGINVFTRCFGLLNEKIYDTLGSFQNEKKIFKFNGGMQKLPGDRPKFIFNSREDIKEVDLNDLQELPDYYFNGCSNLEKVIGQNLTKIGEGVFLDCTRLTEIVGDKIEYIGKSAFENAENLEKINLENVKEISESSLKGCTKIIDKINLDPDSANFSEIVKLNY